MQSHSVSLISNGSATSSWYQWPGGTGVFQVAGTFNGATIKLQFMGPDNSTAIDVGVEVTLTAAGMGGFVLPPGPIRASVTGSPSGIYAVAARVPS